MGPAETFEQVAREFRLDPDAEHEVRRLINRGIFAMMRSNNVQDLDLAARNLRGILAEATILGGGGTVTASSLGFSLAALCPIFPFC
ncbi:hypothetical protein BG58_31435 [Caballeronia jiangsuensis]|nr:hypothetical protein BG58_31435 [Caballeronia jiangsuensis]